MADGLFHPVPYRPDRVSIDVTLETLRGDYRCAEARRTVRMFSSDPVPREAIEYAIRIAGTAPSGAHKQPWYFVAIQDAAMKQRIRDEAEAAEKTFYERLAPPEWLEALAPLEIGRAHV